MASLTITILKYVLILLFMATLLNYTIYTFNAFENIQLFNTQPQEATTDVFGFIINTSGCKIPNMLLYPPDLNKYYKNVKPIECDDKRSALFESNYTSIFMNESALPDYGIKDKNLLKCCFILIKRPIPSKGNSSTYPDDSNIIESECVLFDIDFRSPYEFIKIHCFKVNTAPESKVLTTSEVKALHPIYTDYFYFVHPPQIENNASRNNDDKVNVLIVGIDSTSRLNFHRQMPRTFQALENLEAVEFFGYNKIADNTFPNVIALLTGNSSEEIKNGCFNKSLTDKVFDNCHFIWDDYKAHGYTTAFIEDAVKTGLFNYKPDKKGFFKQPTDVYWEHFYTVTTKEIGNANKVIGTQPYCFGTRKIFEVMLEYINKFTTIMGQNSQPYFGHFWQSLICHDDINQIQHGDAGYSDLLIYLNQSGLLENTVLFFMSDHGFRFGELRKTYQGMMEDRLPFVFVKLPDRLKQRFPHLQDNLKINSRRLVTMYDLHATMKHLLEPLSLQSIESSWNYGKRRGNSLLAPISEDRTCADADIPSQWCVCGLSIPVSLNDETVVSIAKFIVAHINDNILKDFSDCVHLSLAEVIYARKTLTPEMVTTQRKSSSEIFTIGFKVEPSKALFEGTVNKLKNGTTSHYFTLSDTISRLQLYKNESLCINNHFAQMYCFCSDLLIKLN